MDQARRNASVLSFRVAPFMEAAVERPAQWGRLKHGIAVIDRVTAFDEEIDKISIATPGGIVERRIPMRSFRYVPFAHAVSPPTRVFPTTRA